MLATGLLIAIIVLYATFMSWFVPASKNRKPNDNFVIFIGAYVAALSSILIIFLTNG